ncbi:MAG TPA: hypothetical protein VJ914_04475 [Pseudonocardiaceae bacterium]|nr:hypothetical protein [Pseudonocardiaceae bacterium]
MITRQALNELIDGYTSVRDRVMDIGYALDDLLAPSRSASASLGQTNLSIIDEVSRVAIHLNQAIVSLEDIKPQG